MPTIYTKLQGFWLFSLLLACTASNADNAKHSASFDCAKASTNVEKMICSQKSMQDLDGKMAKEYHAAMGRLDTKAEKQQLLAEQRAWLKKRNTCTDDACLLTAYSFRIPDLEDINPGKKHYVVDMEYYPPSKKDKPFCRQMAALANTYGLEILRHDASKLLEIDGVSLPDWQSVDISQSQIQAIFEASAFFFIQENTEENIKQRKKYLKNAKNYYGSKAFIAEVNIDNSKDGSMEHILSLFTPSSPHYANRKISDIDDFYMIDHDILPYLMAPQLTSKTPYLHEGASYVNNYLSKTFSANRPVPDDYKIKKYGRLADEIVCRIIEGETP